MTNNHEAEQQRKELSPENRRALQELVDSVDESLEPDRNRLSQRILRLLFPGRDDR